MTAAIPRGLVRGNPVLVALLRKSLYRALQSHDYTADEEHMIVECGVRELTNAGLYVTESGGLWMPEWTVH